MDEGSGIAVKELKRLIDSGAQIHLIDVREQYEYDFCRINGSRLMPISQIRNRVNDSAVRKSMSSFAMLGSVVDG